MEPVSNKPSVFIWFKWRKELGFVFEHSDDAGKSNIVFRHSHGLHMMMIWSPSFRMKDAFAVTFLLTAKALCSHAVGMQLVPLHTSTTLQKPFWFVKPESKSPQEHFKLKTWELLRNIQRLTGSGVR